MSKGIIFSALGTNAGKTLIVAALLRLLRQQGHTARGLKVGPDYIDPGFHRIASGRDCANLDLWAMRAATVAGVMNDIAPTPDYIIVEGVMGLFDGTVDGAGSTADVAVQLGLPIILIANAQGQGASLAASISGFLHFRPDIRFAGVIINGISSPRHERIIRRACEDIDVPILGCPPMQPELRLSSRHLGLVQAYEQEGLDLVLDKAAQWLSKYLDLQLLSTAMKELSIETTATGSDGIPPLGQRIAVARDVAFAFSYPHLLAEWRSAGAELCFFSPLADEAPIAAADAVYLPGGYPELYAGQLATAENFKQGVRELAAAGAKVFGECGGYMVLGDRLIDGEGAGHEMIGLLSLTTSFAKRKLHLGYRKLKVAAPEMFDNIEAMRGHEFHYASIIEQGDDAPLFWARDGFDENLGPAGQRRGRVMGSFMHLIDRV